MCPADSQFDANQDLRDRLWPRAELILDGLQQAHQKAEAEAKVGRTVFLFSAGELRQPAVWRKTLLGSGEEARISREKSEEVTYCIRLGASFSKTATCLVGKIFFGLPCPELRTGFPVFRGASWTMMV